MKLPAIHFYPGDWLRDHVAGCSLGAQGLWLRMMILMHDSERYGHLCLNGSPIPPESLARRCGCDSLAQYESLLAELESVSVPSRTNSGVIYSRRMVRDDRKRKSAVTYGRQGGNPNLKKTLNPPLKGLPEGDKKMKESGKGEPEGKQFPDNLDTPEFIHAWKRWERHRHEIKKRITPSMQEASLKKLSTYGPSRGIQIIDYTMEKGWQGLADENQVPRTKATNLALRVAPAPQETI